jgi:type IV pilus assembly protein PilA
MNIKQNKQKGFTLIEILVVIGIIGILATVVLVAVNPNRQFKQARDSQRVANINTILNAIGQNIADHEGNLFCEGAIQDIQYGSVINMPISSANTMAGGLNIATCLTPEYLPKLPFDPKYLNAHWVNEDDYNTGYYVSFEPNNRITVWANGELQDTVSVTR